MKKNVPKKERKSYKVYEIFRTPSIQSSGGWDPMLICHLPFPLVVGRSIFNTLSPEECIIIPFPFGVLLGVGGV
jgi:hypothetical protein